MPDEERTMIERELAEIKTMLKTSIEQGKDHENRLRALEGVNGKKWEQISASVLSAIVLGIVGFILGKFI
jgi:hypothetical protein